jgi:hypothetical protein
MKEKNVILNSKIDEACVCLKAIKSWINDPNLDKQAEANIENWLYKLLTKIEFIAGELK